MDTPGDRTLAVVGSVLVVLLAGAMAAQAGIVPIPWQDDRDNATVTIYDGNETDADTESGERSSDGGDEASADGNGTDGGDGAAGSDDGGGDGANGTDGTDDGNQTDRDAVEIYDEESDAALAEIEVEVADTPSERYTGLSEHESLAEGEGMLFVHDEEQSLTYVMRDMDFGIDIAMIDADGRITEIHNARAPGPDEDGEEMRYSGRGKYVLEVPKGYMAEQNVSVGDRVEIEYEVE